LCLARRAARHQAGAARPVRLHAACRLRCLRGEEAERCGSLRPDRQALFGVLSADRRRQAHGAASAHAAQAFGERRLMNALTQHEAQRATADLPSADELDRAVRGASPAEVITAALRIIGRERLALVSSFGTESAALLKVMAEVDPEIPVIFLDTGWLFEE